MKQPLGLLIQTMGAGQPDVAQPRPVTGGFRVGEPGLQLVVVHPVDLERKEQ